MVVDKWEHCKFEGWDAVRDDDHTIVLYRNGTGTLFTSNGPVHSGTLAECYEYSRDIRSLEHAETCELFDSLDEVQ